MRARRSCGPNQVVDLIARRARSELDVDQPRSAFKSDREALDPRAGNCGRLSEPSVRQDLSVYTYSPVGSMRK